MADCTRREFTRLLLAGVGVAAFGGLAACSVLDGTVAMSNGSVTLVFAQFPQLATVGGAAIVGVQDSFPIAVVRTTATAAVALSATCTHQGCTLRYEAGPNDLHCDCHDANFALSGDVLSGPTSIPLPSYMATVGSDAIRVAITG